MQGEVTQQQWTCEIVRRPDYYASCLLQSIRDPPEPTPLLTVTYV